jgi:ribosomal-protein-alanine acetyltransferase
MLVSSLRASPRASPKPAAAAAKTRVRATPACALLRHAPMEGVRLRAAQIADIPSIMAIEARCFRSDRASARGLVGLIRNGRAVVLVATRNAEVLGYVGVQFRADSDCARIYSIALKREARGLGLGRLLMRAAERQARRRGCTRMRLEVRLSNRRALGLYRALGYATLTALPAYYSDGGDALRMEKPLGKSPRAPRGR